MKLQLQIPQIHCLRTTLELTPDEIYLAVLVLGGKMENNKFALSASPTFARVSEVERRVKKGKSWSPQFTDLQVDLGEDAEAFCVALALYEGDNLKIHEQLKNGNFQEFITPEKFDWEGFFDKLKQAIIKDVNDNEKIDAVDIWAAITTRPDLKALITGTFLVDLFKGVFKHLRQDDLFDIKTSYFIPNGRLLHYDKEFNFSKFRGIYEVEMRMEVLEA